MDSTEPTAPPAATETDAVAAPQPAEHSVAEAAPAQTAENVEDSLVQPPAPKLSPAQERKAADDAALAALETELSKLSEDDRKHYFFHRKDAESARLVHLLQMRVDSIRNPADRKAFFLAHPELEVRFSAKNFIK